MLALFIEEEHPSCVNQIFFFCLTLGLVARISEGNEMFMIGQCWMSAARIYNIYFFILVVCRGPWVPTTST